MSTQTAETVTHAVGDLVTANPDYYGPSVTRSVYRITAVPRGARGVNYVGEPYDTATGTAIPGARGVRGPAVALLPYNPDAPAAVVTEVPIPAYVPTPNIGSIVRITNVPKINPAHLYVVLAPSSRGGGVKVTRLGGFDGDRYWRHIPMNNVTVVPYEDVVVD